MKSATQWTTGHKQSWLSQQFVSELKQGEKVNVVVLKQSALSLLDIGDKHELSQYEKGVYEHKGLLHIGGKVCELDMSDRNGFLWFNGPILLQMAFERIKDEVADWNVYSVKK